MRRAEEAVNGSSWLQGLLGLVECLQLQLLGSRTSAEC